MSDTDTLRSRLILQGQLLGHEGFRRAAYTDSEGYLTIGCGRMIDAKKGGGVTPEEGLYLLGNDITTAEAELDRALPWWRKLDTVRQRVLANMTMNLGIANLLDFKATLRDMQDGRVEEAAEGMLASLWARQVGRRADQLALVYRTGRDLA